MKLSLFKFVGTSLIGACTSASLIAAQVPARYLNLPLLASSIEPKAETTVSENLDLFLELDDLSLIIADQMDETDPDDVDSSSYFNDGEDTVPGGQTSTLPKDLYNPQMDYGTGAPAPKLAPVSTLTRNLVFFAASVVLASVGMTLASSNNGKPAPSSNP